MINIPKSPLDLLIKKEMWASFEAGLTAGEYEFIQLRYFELYSFRKLAKLFGFKGRPAAQKELARILKKCLELLNEKEN